MPRRTTPRVTRVAPDLIPRFNSPAGLMDAGGPASECWLEKSLPVTGQGVVSLEVSAEGSFRIILSAQDQSTAGDVIVLEVGAEGACFRNKNDREESSVLKRTERPGDGLNEGQVNSYWLSLDSQNRRLRYGKGYAQAQLTLMQWDYPAGDEPAELDPAKLPYAWTEQLEFVCLEGVEPSWEPRVNLYPMPVVADVPALIVADSSITMDQLAVGDVTVVENLSNGCQILYGNVAGPSIQLNTPDFPDFADAINYSIVTEGCVCYELLKSKEGEFGETNPRGTYLRITLGDNLGDSPGIPYVLEIWPGQNYSPIHNHSGADAVIKVLHGQIQSRWYAELSPLYLDYYEKFDLFEGQVTWLSPEYYQTHQLFNPAPPGHMCATLQCYRYPDGDNEHYEYFDYLYKDENGEWQIGQFYPNSDMNYLDFKAAVRAEWNAYVAASEPDV